MPNTLQTAARDAARFAFRLLAVWLVDAVSLLVTAQFVPGLSIQSNAQHSALVVASSAALMIGLINLLIRPLILLLALPLGFVVLFIAGFLANAVVLVIAGNVVPGLAVDGWLAALIGGVALAAANTAISGILFANDDQSFYQGVVERLAGRQRFDASPEQGPDHGQGLVMLEIDGLGVRHLQSALDHGVMPALARLIDQQQYRVSRFDCGLPAQTSSCQAGIMFGDNFDIPAFRWYDKANAKLYVSVSDAAELNQRYAKGQGLMRGGSSICNLLNGDSRKSLLTFANLFTGSAEERRRRAEDIYLLILNPYFLTRVIALSIGDVLLELGQAWNQRRRRVEPRLDRLRKFYPLIRASTTVFMRDVAASLVIFDIIRGSPSIYMTYLGYDEVAHYSGPWSSDAFGTLRQFDRVVARVLDAIERKAPRPYELILLSDHGQSFGASFKQRYGVDLKQHIESLTAAGTRVVQSMGGDDGAMSVMSMAGELANLQEQGPRGRVGREVVKGTQRALERMADQRADDDPPEHAAPATDTAGAGAKGVIVCGSGNIAQVYFDVAPRRLLLQELNAAHPGLVDGLINHPGIGFVVAYGEGGIPIAFGKRGARNLHTGAVTGADPLASYGDAELRARQVRRVADYPHAGDLIVNSTLFEDGTVAALEEQIGSHGGLGGEQTDAFLFHPADMAVPVTTNSADVFPILNARRGLVKAAPAAASLPAQADDWQMTHLAAGLARTSKWIALAVRAAGLERDAYRSAASDALMTGPALLIGLLSVAVSTLLDPAGWQLSSFLINAAALLVSALAAFAAGRALGGRANFTQTLRALGFARGIYVLGVVGLIPALAPYARFMVSVGGFFTAWMAVAEAHRISGWRAFVLPVMAVLAVALGAAVLNVSAAGASLTLDTLLRMFGMAR